MWEEAGRLQREWRCEVIRAGIVVSIGIVIQAGIVVRLYEQA